LTGGGSSIRTQGGDGRADPVRARDDLTPGFEGPDIWRDLLDDPRVAAVEILTSPDTAAIVAVRR
jgi:hypothetical protein